MRKAVLDSTVLVSAFLKTTGVSYALLRQAFDGAYLPCLADEILEEVGKVLRYPRIRKKAVYGDDEIKKYIAMLATIGQIVSPLPRLRAVVRDPNDDMIVACAIKAKAQHIITRDKDLLDIGNYQKIKIVTPEAYLAILRESA